MVNQISGRKKNRKQIKKVFKIFFAKETRKCKETFLFSFLIKRFFSPPKPPNLIVISK